MATKKKLFIDERFSVPGNLNTNDYEYVFDGKPIGMSTTWDDDTLVDLDEDDTDINSNTETNSQSGSGSLDPPTNLIVLSQTLRIGAAGIQVVDIVIQCDDVDGATKYNARYSKI